MHGGCNSEKDLKKASRGEYDGADLKSGITLDLWFYIKAVQLASNYILIESVDQVQRWSKSEKKIILGPRPHNEGQSSSYQLPIKDVPERHKI